MENKTKFATRNEGGIYRLAQPAGEVPIGEAGEGVAAAVHHPGLAIFPFHLNLLLHLLVVVIARQVEEVVDEEEVCLLLLLDAVRALCRHLHSRQRIRLLFSFPPSRLIFSPVRGRQK
jgi:hypothetical protein